MVEAPCNLAPPSRPLRIFLVAGEHSGDALGAKLMVALKAQLGSNGVTFAGTGAEEMAHEGLVSIFPMADVAVMGPLHILKALPRIVRRVYQTVNAALDFKPDAVVIIDSPEFTHPVARRIRKRAPEIPIIDFVCPSVWAWRSGRAPKMAGYIDEVLCLLPFEPEALRKLKGPHGTYAGHPLIERLDEIRNAPAAALAERLGLDPARPVLLVLPGSRRSEIAHLIGDFGATVARVARDLPDLGVVIPAVSHLRDRIASATAGWAVKPHIVGPGDKYAAMRLSRAALAASGTVTLELGLAGTPSVVAYKSDNLTAFVVRQLITTDTAVLTNLVLGERVFPEFIQHDCTAGKLSAALVPLLGDTPQRAAQIAALARVPPRMVLASGTPSAAAAEAVLNVLAQARRR